MLFLPDVFLTLAWMLCLPAGTVLLMLVLSRTERFGRVPGRLKQCLFGCVFGILSILLAWAGRATLDEGAFVSLAAAAPMSAGLIFGSPAGVLAGAAGAAGLLLSTGAGASSSAAAFTVLLSGLTAALLRRYVFRERICTWYYGLLAGAFIQAVGMLMHLLVQRANSADIFQLIQGFGLLLICANAGAVALAVTAAQIRRGKADAGRGALPPVKVIFQRWLILAFAAAFAVTAVCNWALEGDVSRRQAEEELAAVLDGVRSSILAGAERIVLDTAVWVRDAAAAENPPDMDRWLQETAEAHGLACIIIVGADGQIQADAGRSLLESETARISELVPGENAGPEEGMVLTSLNTGSETLCAAVPAENGEFIIIGMERRQLEDELLAWLNGTIAERTFGNGGILFVSDAEGEVLSLPSEAAGLTPEALRAFSEEAEARSFFEGIIGGTRYFGTCETLAGYTLWACLPATEVYQARTMSVHLNALTEFTIFAALFLLVVLLARRLMTDPVEEITEDLAQIAGGALDVVVDVQGSREFSELSGDLNHTVAALKNYIAQAEQRVEAELALARSIQLSALPSVFPPWPGHPELDLYASTQPAREVGGDFYDFFLLGDEHLVLVVADVSGKGIPAALFMMTAKTLIKDLAESGLPVQEVLTRANAQLCENNKEDMFVTCWLGIVDLRTGMLCFANAGHNYPLLRNGRDGSFAFLKERPGFVLGGLEGMRYKAHEIRMKPGSVLFLYTDGIPEAENTNKELYGDARLLACLNAHPEAAAKILCREVAASVERFTDGAQQSDDLTMLAFELAEETRTPDMSITVKVEADSTEELVTAFETEADRRGIPLKAAAQLCIGIDEVFSNIVRYSGAKCCTMDVQFHQSSVEICFADDGMPYDPTQQTEPDVTLSADEREPGGLGILLVRRMMDEVRYTYADGHNLLSIVKAYATNGGSPTGKESRTDADEHG